MSQSGAAAVRQSAVDWHCTQSCVTGSQRGVAPLQSVSAAQVPHVCLTHTLPVGEPAQPVRSSHWTHALSSQRGADGGHPAVQGCQHRPDLHTPPPAQSLDRPHSTQRFISGSQRGRPAVVQWVSSVHATQRLDAQWSEDSPQSPSLAHDAESSKRRSP
jgi:hypothetical protein